MNRNPYGRSAQEEAEYRRHLWPGTDVPKNGLGIRDRIELEQVERLIVSQRVEGGFPKEVTSETYVGLKAIHRHMFQDIYEWAGQERKYTTGRGPAPFAKPEFIAPSMEKLFEDLRSQKFLKNLNRKDFSRKAAWAVSEVNAAHPFIDGNGRTQRQWLRHLADQAGYVFALTNDDVERWNAASREGFQRSDDPMAELIFERTTTRRLEIDRSSRNRRPRRTR